MRLIQLVCLSLSAFETMLTVLQADALNYHKRLLQFIASLSTAYDVHVYPLPCLSLATTRIYSMIRNSSAVY